MSRAKRIAVIGAGPIGLEAALYGRAAGHQVVVMESGDLASHMARWGFVQLFTPWSMNTTPLGRRTAGSDPIFKSEVCPTGAELIDSYLNPIYQSPMLYGCVDLGIRVLSVSRESRNGETEPGAFQLEVSDRYGVEQFDSADIILDCSGTYGNLRWVGPGGNAAAGEFGLRNRICYTLPDVLGRDRYRFANRHTLLIGAGTSASSILMNLATLYEEEPETHVIWAIESLRQLSHLIAEDPLPSRRRLVERVLQLVQDAPPWLELMDEAVIEQFNAMSGLNVTLRCGERTVSQRVDEIIAAIGYQPDESVFKPLGVLPRYVSASETQALVYLRDASVIPGSAGNGGVVNPTPGYFILGAKSYGLNGNFLMRIGHGQIREVFRKINNDPRLDLYAGGG